MTEVQWKGALVAIALAIGVLEDRGLAQSNSSPGQEQALSVRAEQAFATLNYQEAFKLGQQVIALNPRNKVARRLTAASAFELGKHSECLRIMSSLPPQEVTSDDIHTIGGCAEKAKGFSPALLRFLEGAQKDPSRIDAASYWLGLTAYRNGEFNEAKGLLAKALVLPTRLAEQKRFMLERIEDISSNQKPPQNPPEPPRNREKNTDLRPQPRQMPPNALRSELIPRRESKNGLFTSFVGTVAAGAGVGAINEVSTLTGRQDAFDNDVDASIREGRDVNPETIAVSEGVLVTPLGGFAADLITGYRSADFVGGLGTEYAFDLKLSTSYSKLEGASYAVDGTRLHPSGLRAFPTAGAGARLGGHVEWRLGPSFKARTEVFIDRLAVNLEEQYGQTGGEGSLVLGSDAFAVRFGGFWHLLQGDDLVFGGHWNGFELDLEIAKLGFFSLAAPSGHSLISYQVSAPIPDSTSTGVFQIVSTEGKYLEFNLAPTVTFSPYFKTLLWYRFVSGTERSYISSVTKRRQKEQSDFGVKYPDSQYDSSLSELSAAIEYTPWTWGGFRTGVSAIFYGTQYQLTNVPPNPSSPGSSPALYTKLLDRGSQNATLAFGTLYARF